MISLLWCHLYSSGQKGIGFKSVFKVSDCPEIHSNGFHLRFDKTSGPMGYILPHWAEVDRPLDSQLEDIKQHRWDCWQMCCLLYRYFKNITKYSLNKNIWLRTNRLKLNMLLLKKTIRTNTFCCNIQNNQKELCSVKKSYLLNFVQNYNPETLISLLFVFNSWTTKICLPLRSQSHQTRNLFHDVHPSLLLFLHRLRSITIYNQVNIALIYLFYNNTCCL